MDFIPKHCLILFNYLQKVGKRKTSGAVFRSYSVGWLSLSNHAPHILPILFALEVLLMYLRTNNMLSFTSEKCQFLILHSFNYMR